MDKGWKRGKPTTREKRGPLQDLNGHPICKKTSIPSSASSSSSRTLIDKNPKPYPKSTVNHGNKASAADASKSVIRSKENELSRKPNLKKSQRVQPLAVGQKPWGKIIRKPNLKKSQRVQPLAVGQKPWGKIMKPVKNDQRLKVSSSVINPANKLKKVPQQLQVKAKTSHENCTESSASLFRHSLLTNLDLRNVGVINDPANEASNGSTAGDVKMPPVEVSSSPEIQRHFHSKVRALKLAATPICYGAGHLVLGITDNLKCRRRGSLRGACERTNLFDVERSDEECAIVNLQESMVPLPAEASVRWVLSPCHEAHEDQVYIGDSAARLGQRRVSCHYDLDRLICCLRHHCYESSYSGASSVGLLDSGNIIQTPNSDDCDEVLRSEVDCSNFIDAEIYSISEMLSRLDMSLTDEIPEWEASVLDSILFPHNLTKLHQNVDSVSSWASDSMPENVTLSQMKILWMDGLVSRNVQTDDLDCCCLLDDES